MLLKHRAQAYKVSPKVATTCQVCASDTYITKPIEFGTEQLVIAVMLSVHWRWRQQRETLFTRRRRKQCQTSWKEKLLSSQAARAALVLPSRSDWRRMVRTSQSLTRKVLTQPRPSSRRLNALAEKQSRFRQTPPMPTRLKPRSKRPLQPSEDWMCW